MSKSHRPKPPSDRDRLKALQDRLDAVISDTKAIRAQIGDLVNREPIEDLQRFLRDHPDPLGPPPDPDDRSKG